VKLRYLNPFRWLRILWTAIRDTRNEMRRGLNCKKCGKPMFEATLEFQEELNRLLGLN
jgi:hypothetical protein